MSSLATKKRRSRQYYKEGEMNRKFFGSKSCVKNTSCNLKMSQNKDSSLTSYRRKHRRRIAKFYDFLKWRSKKFASSAGDHVKYEELPKRDNRLSPKWTKRARQPKRKVVMCDRCQNNYRNKICLHLQHNKLEGIMEKSEEFLDESSSISLASRSESRLSRLLSSWEKDRDLAMNPLDSWELKDKNKHDQIVAKEEVYQELYTPHSDIVNLRQRLRASWKSEGSSRGAPSHILPLRSDLILKPRESDIHLDTEASRTVPNWLEVKENPQFDENSLTGGETKLRKAPWLRNLHFLPK